MRSILEVTLPPPRGLTQVLATVNILSSLFLVYPRTAKGDLDCHPGSKLWLLIHCWRWKSSHTDGVRFMGTHIKPDKMDGEIITKHCNTTRPKELHLHSNNNLIHSYLKAWNQNLLSRDQNFLFTFTWMVNILLTYILSLWGGI